MDSEQYIQQAIRLRCGRNNKVRLWRNNTGVLMDRNGRPVQFGLCPGSSDLIGLRQVVVTPDMVGQAVAVFVAIEVKGAKGRVSEKQQNFIVMVKEMGGFAGVARTVEDAEKLLSE